MLETELKFEMKNVKSPYDGKYYIGFVCDILNEYFRLRSKCYLINTSGGDVSRSNFAVILMPRNKRVKLSRIGEDTYAVSGISEDGKFEEFKKVAQSKLETLLDKMQKERNQNL